MNDIRKAAETLGKRAFTRIAVGHDWSKISEIDRLRWELFAMPDGEAMIDQAHKYSIKTIYSNDRLVRSSLCLAKRGVSVLGKSARHIVAVAWFLKLREPMA